MNLAAFALRNERLVLLLAVALFVYGLALLPRFPSQEDPPIMPREAIVTTYLPGFAPLEVERLVTREIEKTLAKIPERKHITSFSWSGKSVVHLEIQDRYFDLDRIWQDLRNRVSDLAPHLPDGVIGPFVNDDFGDVTIVSVAITADGFSMAEAYEVAKDLQDEIYLLDGVGRVDLLGVQEERIWVEFQIAKVAQLGLSPATVREALESQNVVLPGGSIDMGAREVLLRPSGDLKTVEELRDLAIDLPDGDGVIYLRDIARIERGYADPPEAPIYYDGSPAILLSVVMGEGHNVLSVGPQVRELAARYEQRLPLGYRLQIGNYQPTFVERAVRGVATNLVQTIIIVLVVVVGFLGPRTGFIVGLHVPFTMLITLVLMYQLGIEMERISLMTLIIALGLLVDNGIVIAEDIETRVGNGQEGREAAAETGRSLAVPLLSSSVTTVLMFLPLALAETATGEYLRSMSLVILLALGTSWVLAMTVTPILCARFIRAQTKHGEAETGGFDRLLRAVYRPALELVLRTRVLFLAIMGAALVGGLSLFGYVPQQFMPESDRPQVLLKVRLPAGNGIRETDRQMRRLVDWLEDESSNPEVEQTIAYVGSGGVRFFVALPPLDPAANMGFVLVRVESREAANGLLTKIRERVRTHHPEMNVGATRMFMGATETGMVEVRISGPDADTLQVAGERVASIFESIPGTVNVYNDWENRFASVLVRVDQTRARRAKVTSEDLARTLHAALDGSEFSVLRQGDEEIPIVSRASAIERESPERIRTLEVYSSTSGWRIPIIQVADIEPVSELSLVKRRDHARSVQIESKSTALTAVELESAVRPEVDALVAALGEGYRWEFGGETETRSESLSALMASVPLCLFAIFIVLVGQFDSYRKATLIAMTVPLAIAGVPIGLLVSGSFFGFMTILGILSLVGIVVNNAIVMIEQINVELEAGKAPYDAIVDSCLARLRPIVMTTLTTILGLLPIILSGDPLFYPMANTIAYGLAFGTALTLGVAPVLYAILYRVPAPAQSPAH